MPVWFAPSSKHNRYLHVISLALPLLPYLPSHFFFPISLSHVLSPNRTSLTTGFLVQRFFKEGCPNCEDFLRLAGSSEAIQECTSQVFEGLITLADPSKSWVAKWQRLDSYVPGVYATKVAGILPEEVIDTMEGEARMKYIP